METKVNIIVIGANGRMGKTIIQLCQSEPGFNLAGAVESSEHIAAISHLPCPVSDKLSEVLKQVKNGVIIDFTAPNASVQAAGIAADMGTPMVIGTTGLNEDQKKQLQKYALKAPMLWSANMSIGVNVLMDFLPLLAKALGANYDIEMVEMHHKRKKDAPSGTALMLGEVLAQARGLELANVRNSCRDGLIGERPAAEIGIQAIRGGDVVGVHKIYFLGPGEMIEVAHTAESRENFAQGAIRAVSWLVKQPAGKLYSMRDVIKISD